MAAHELAARGESPAAFERRCIPLGLPGGSDAKPPPLASRALRRDGRRGSVRHDHRAVFRHPWGVARLRRRSDEHEVLAARPDHAGELHRPGDRLALAVALDRCRKPVREHPAAPVQGHTAHGGRPALRQHGARSGGRARRRHGRARLVLRSPDVRPSRPAGQRRLAAPRRLLLGGRLERRGPDLHRDARPAARRPGRSHRRSGSGLRRRRRRRPQRQSRTPGRPGSHHALVAGRHRRRYGGRRQRGAGSHRDPRGPARTRARLRRPYRRDEVDLPHHSARR